MLEKEKCARQKGRTINRITGKTTWEESKGHQTKGSKDRKYIEKHTRVVVLAGLIVR